MSICKNCGMNIPDGSAFCPNCGSPAEQKAEKCPFCGAPITPDSEFCGNCGHRTEYVDAGNNYDRYAHNNKKNNGNKGFTALIISLSAVALALVIFLVWLIFLRTPSTKKESMLPTTAPTAAPVSTLAPATATPVPTASPESMAVTAAPAATAQPQRAGNSAGYSNYTDSKFHWSCDYPASFIVYDDGTEFARYSMKSPNGSGYFRLCATYADDSTTPDSFRSNFVRDYGGSIEYKSMGSDYCSLRTLNGSTYHYCYFKIINGMVRGFEAHFSSSHFSEYDAYINEMYKSIEWR